MNDTKSLKPELKEIYERVMNTRTAVPAAPAPAQTNQSTQTASAANPTALPSNPSAPANPVPATPKAPPTVNPISSKAPQFFTNTSAHAALSSANKEFVYSSHGTKIKPPKEDHHKEPPHPKQVTHTAVIHPQTANGFLNGKIIALIVIFLIIWTLFWLIFLGVIQPSTFGI